LALDLSIIIVSWNTRDALRDCLASLPRAVEDLASEVLVVDNASRDGTPEMVRGEFPACRLLESGGNLGFARANNLALAEARGRLLLLLNPDTVCPRGSLAGLVACLDGLPPTVAAAGPTLVDDRGRPVASYGDFPALRMHWFGLLDPRGCWLPRNLRAGLGRVPEPGRPGGPVDYLKGACLLLRRSALEQVGPLDERYFLYFEETDWCWRARRAGLRVFHCADVQVVHLEGGAAELASAFCLAQFQHSYRLFVAAHYGRRRVLAFRAAQLCEYSWKGILRGLLPGRQNRAWARKHFAVARLQLRGDLAPRPPA
jgi:N-acetylglucosaminyl-diphospho-decaprenol L-rhamnosyltransferase